MPYRIMAVLITAGALFAAAPAAQAKPPARAQSSSLYEYAATLANSKLRHKHWSSGTPRWCGWHGWDCIKIAVPILKSSPGHYYWWGPSMWTGRCFYVCWSLRTWITAGTVNTKTGKVVLAGRG